MFGTSLGATIALLVSNKNEDVSKIILNLTGADLVETVWGWGDIVNKEFKMSFEKEQITLKELKNHWKQINPINNLDNQVNKKFLIYLAKHDEIIPYSQGERLLSEFKKRKFPYLLKINNTLRHIYAATFNLFCWNTYLGFLS